MDKEYEEPKMKVVPMEPVSTKGGGKGSGFHGGGNSGNPGKHYGNNDNQDKGNGNHNK